MTKPNEFILNSDYLALAQTGTTEVTAYFSAETFSAGSTHIRTRDFTVASSQGAIDATLISLNGSDYILGSHLTDNVMQPTMSFFVRRTSPTNIQVQLRVYTSRTGGYSMPLQTVKVKIASFKPPNVF